MNPALKDSPEVVNQDPFGEGWMIQIRLSSPGEFDDLMTAAEYRAGL